MKQNKKDPKKSPAKDARNLEKNQATTNSEVREGQEDSSILHDENEGNKQLPRDVTKKDDGSGGKEEFIEDRNT